MLQQAAISSQARSGAFFFAQTENIDPASVTTAAV